MKPIIAIIGRPNSGKSTFFNRITKTQNALVDNFPGITRDRHYGDALWNGKVFTIVDTGGFVEEDMDEFAVHIRFQIERAIEDADSIILLLDGKTGLSPYDSEIFKLLRDCRIPVFYVINKIDSLEQEDRVYEFYSLGIKKLYSVSAAHGYGIRDLMDEVVENFDECDDHQEEKDIIKISVTGRPNVGKSSLINTISGEERLVVTDIPGTTRDCINTLVQMNSKSYLFIDTAGIRRKRKVFKKIEKFSVIKALKSLEQCDIALILIDAAEGITEQDITIAGYAFNRGCGCIFLINKWDAIQKDYKTEKIYHQDIRYSAKFLSFAPILTVSALTGLRVKKIFPLIRQVYTQYSHRIDTGPLNRILMNAVERREPPFHKNKRLKFYYAAQISSKPPTFVLFVNYPEAVHFSYKRYLTNQFREKAALANTPVKLFFRQRTGRIEFGKKSNTKR